MAIKPTKRKAFNFLRSYFDVYNELQNDKDRLKFLESIINKQFLDEDPKGLNFIVNLCYESQRHAIEKSVKGWKTANKIDLLGNPTPPKGSPSTSPKGSPRKEEEEKEEVKEKVKVKEESLNARIQKFLSWFNSSLETHKGKKGKFRTLTKTDVNNYKKIIEAEYTIEEFNHAFKQMTLTKWPNENNMLTPSHFLRIEQFNKYLNSNETENKKPNMI